jgi:saccharopine dehydrogenase-like NADP-dependent oxidoreductase
MALDLAKSHDVTAADVDETALRDLRDVAGITTTRLDVTEDRQLEEAVADLDLVISAVPGLLGFETLKRLIEAGKNIVDISFCPENTLDPD